MAGAAASSRSAAGRPKISPGVIFTEFFRALSAGTARALFTEPEPFDSWAARREALLPADRAAVADAMDRVNPVYIRHNHRVEEALATATKGDMGLLRQLVDAFFPPLRRAARIGGLHPSGPRMSPIADPEHGPGDGEGRSARLLGAFRLVRP